MILLRRGVLIESDWNLKKRINYSDQIVRLRINRIRLEFKVNNARVQCGFCHVLIESDWNLKNIQLFTIFGVHDVLIESDWNLKEFQAVTMLHPAFVLIESDWNLKPKY